MELVLAVLRPKQHATVSHDFRPKAFDILLTDIQLSNTDKNKSIKTLPKTTISYEAEPAEELFDVLYHLTGGENGGLKGKRAVFVPGSKSESTADQDFSVRGTLYCIPVDNREKLNPDFVENAPHTPGFYSLDLVLDSLNNSSYNFSKQTRIMLHRLDSWLREKHRVPGAIDLLFSVSADYRLKSSITNPAYFSDPQSVASTGQFGDRYTRSIANEALAKMMTIEKCDITIKNPLFGSGLPYKPKVDCFSLNPFWGVMPDYSKISLGRSTSRDKSEHIGPNWVEEFPLHKAAYEGSAQEVKELIQKGYSVTKKDKDSWAAIHYAAWYGHVEAITVLLNEGECSPNITTDTGSSPLHFAAANGHPYVVELLLNHPDIDVSALDKHDKTALQLCEKVDKPEWKAVHKLLRRAMNRPSPKIQVWLMDLTYRMLNLVSGANTTVQQLHGQMVAELNLDESCAHLFTIWICSRNLQLQLKSEHKPIQHLNDWKRKIVGLLTDSDPSREDPQIFWRRDAILSIAEEKDVQDPMAINLLFHEAYHNYIRSLYPCSDQDAIIMSGILMQLNQGDYEQRKTKTFFQSENSLSTLIPVNKRRNKSINWVSKIQLQYKTYSQSMQNKDRSPQGLQLHFLTLCWNLTVYGSAFFTGYVQIRSARTPTPLYIGVNDIGIHIIHSLNKSLMQSFSYSDITWEHKIDRPILDIKLRDSPKGGMSIVTRQRGLINYLMTKLAQIHPHENSAYSSTASSSSQGRGVLDSNNRRSLATGGRPVRDSRDRSSNRDKRAKII